MPQRVSISAATLPTPPMPTTATCRRGSSPQGCSLVPASWREWGVAHCVGDRGVDSSNGRCPHSHSMARGTKHVI